MFIIIGTVLSLQSDEEFLLCWNPAASRLRGDVCNEKVFVYYAH